MFQNFPSYLFIILLRLNFKKMLERSDIFCFYEWKNTKTQMLSMLLIIIQFIMGEIRIWMIQDLDSLMQAFLLPKPMLITVTLKNGTNLILYSEQPKEIIFQNVSYPFSINASPSEQLPEQGQN